MSWSLSYDSTVDVSLGKVLYKYEKLEEKYEGLWWKIQVSVIDNE